MNTIKPDVERCARLEAERKELIAALREQLSTYLVADNLLAHVRDMNKADAAYIAAAANAYPELIAFVRCIADNNPHLNSARGDNARALLVKLGAA